MHIVIGLISALAGLVWALNALQRSGFTWASVNPFLWARRRKWEKQHGLKPLYKLSDSMEVAAVLITGLAKQNGDVSKETKDFIIQLFSEEFQLDKEAASDLLVSSLFLCKDEVDFSNCVPSIIRMSQCEFSEKQKTTLLEMMERTAHAGGGVTEEQRAVLRKTRQGLKGQ